MDAMLFRNVRIWSADGTPPYPGELLVAGGRIAAIAPAASPVTGAAGALEIDGGGGTLMPGMVDGHSHLSFTDIVSGAELGTIPPEEHTLATMHNAAKILAAGFTGAYGAASAKIRLDVVIRNEIEAGRIPGPRLRAASPEITVTGGLGDANLLHMARESFGLVADGPDALVRAVRLCAREGVDNIKLNISGLDVEDAELTVMKEEEVRIAVETAHEMGKKVSAHARAAESVKRAVRCGVDVIYHCDYADEEALDLLECARDRIFCAPAIGHMHGLLHEAAAFGHSPERARARGIDRLIEASARSHREMHRRGVPIAIGGDYGFASNPHGRNARDIEHFMQYFGFSAEAALQAATRVGGAMMANETGRLREGWRADLLLVDGDPLADVRLLQQPERLELIVKGGRICGGARVPDAPAAALATRQTVPA